MPYWCIAFKCEEPGCGKFFARHDNLLQHQRSHRNSPNHLHSDHLSDLSLSNPLERVYNVRNVPTAIPAKSSSLGVLLPSPFTFKPMSISHTTADNVCDFGNYQNHTPQSQGDVSRYTLRRDQGLYGESYPCACIFTSVDPALM